MVKLSEDAVSAVFAALADPTRRAIVTQLAGGEASVSELAEPFDVSLPAIMKHIGVLERAGLVAHRRVGRVRRCRLIGKRLRVADAWLARYRVFWSARLDALEAHFQHRG
jgi:DNA-binding transcriptional ArsR family regulator